MKKYIALSFIVAFFPLSSLAATASSPSSSARASVMTKKATVVKKASSSSKATAGAKKNSLPYALPITDDWQKKLKLIKIENTEEAFPNVKVVHEQGQIPAFFRIHFPKGSANRFVHKFFGKPIGGMLSRINPDIEGQSEVYFGYSVRFPKDFDFAQGGVLPGIFSGIQNSGVQVNGSYKDESSGSAYVNWGKKGEITVTGGFIKKLIAGAMDTDGKFAADGQWHRIVLHLRKNTHVSKANGLIEVFLDGKKIGTATDIYFQNKVAEGFDGIGFGAMFGGLDVFSTVTQDMYLDLAGFTISKSMIP